MFVARSGFCSVRSGMFVARECNYDPGAPRGATRFRPSFVGSGIFVARSGFSSVGSGMFVARECNKDAGAPRGATQKLRGARKYRSYGALDITAAASTNISLLTELESVPIMTNNKSCEQERSKIIFRTKKKFPHANTISGDAANVDTRGQTRFRLRSVGSGMFVAPVNARRRAS